MRKDYFDISDKSLYLMLFLLNDGEHPAISVSRDCVWNDDNSILFIIPYEGKKSKPEYGLSLSDKNIPKLESFRLENMISALLDM